MITLTANVPSPDQIIAAGFTQVRLMKSGNGTSTGTFAAVTGASDALVSGTTSYTLTDALGGYGDWYATQYTNAGATTVSSLGTAQPGYLSDLCGTIRDLLGVTTIEVTDAQIQGFAYLPAALARVRARFPGFDPAIGAGGDTGTLCLGALAHLTAALLCPRMTVAVVDSEQFKDYRYQRNRQMDWSATQNALFAEYEILISAAAGETSSNPAMYPVATLLAGPTTSGADTSGGLVPLVNPLTGWLG